MARSEPRCAEIASGVLVVGVIAHALLCGPAIGCRGYPPIAPIWYGVTFIWPVAVMISAYFDSTKFANRRKQLIIFALATAFFHGWDDGHCSAPTNGAGRNVVRHSFLRPDTPSYHFRR